MLIWSGGAGLYAGEGGEGHTQPLVDSWPTFEFSTPSSTEKKNRKMRVPADH